MARRQEYTLKNKIVNFVVILVTVLAMVGAAAGIGIYQAMHVSTFYDGVSVDGIVIGGMTYDEAKNALRSREEELLMDARITVSYDDQKTTLDADELGISTNLDSILKNAFTEGIQDKPIDQKYDNIIEMTNGQDFAIELVLDDTQLHNTVKNTRTIRSCAQRTRLQNTINIRISLFIPRAKTAVKLTRSLYTSS